MVGALFGDHGIAGPGEIVRGVEDLLRVVVIIVRVVCCELLSTWSAVTLGDGALGNPRR